MTIPRAALLLAVMAAAALAVLAIPEPAAEFYGSIMLNGDSAEPGLNISARDQSGALCGWHKTTTTGFFGLLSCTGDDADTPADEGPASGETVAFRTNGTAAYVLSGNSSWKAGTFSRLLLLGLKNDSPYLYGCSNATLQEDGSGSDVSIDLWSCSYDRNDNISDLSFALQAQTNTSLISCSVSGNRYVTCANPAKDANGLSFLTVNTADNALLSWSLLLQVAVTPVNDSPFFVQNLTTQFASDNHLFTYDINCSDVDGDEVSFSDNTSLFAIDSSTGLINFTPRQNETGNHSVAITCSDATLSTTQNFTLAVQDVNNPPVLGAIGSQQARETFRYTKTVTATDPDGDNLTFAGNSTLFTINPLTGVINFTPPSGTAGNYSINISVSDGRIADFEVINFTIVVGPFCGDLVCSGEETCTSCSADCGTCPVSSIPGEGGEAGAEAGEAGGAAGAAAQQAAGAAGTAGGTAPRRSASLRQCSEQWTCGDWLACENGVQSRICGDTNQCNTERNKPETTRPCELPVPPAPSCSDRIQNQGEEGVDCGGPCAACATKKIFAEVPLGRIAELIAEIPRFFPLPLLIAVLLLVGLTMAADQTYVRHIRKMPFTKHNKKLRNYRKLRHTIYHVLLNILLLTFTAATYYYAFSNCPDCMKRNLWALGLALAAVPFLAAILLRQLEYSEFKRAIAERRLRNTHARQMRQLAKLQTKMALEIENELVRHIHDYSKKGPSIFTALQDKIFALIDLHSTELALPALDDQTIAALTWARDDKHFAAAITPYVELRQLHEDAAAVMAAATPDARLEAEKNFTDSMENIASDMRLVSIIAGDERLTPAYNGLVDAYLMISALHQTVEENAGKELQLEGSFLKDLQGIFDRKELVEQHQSDHQWVRIYNLLVELHDHYVRKQEMNES